MSASRRQTPVPIMTDDEQRYMAFEGLVQWVSSSIAQGKRIADATATMSPYRREDFRLLAAQVRTEHHYFAIAAYKVLEHREWVRGLGLCPNVDFSMLDQFSASDIRDLRNMREHVVDYFRGVGRDKHRWWKETLEFKADASASAGTHIGGRLDWKQFALAAEALLPALLAEPIPYPPR